MATNEKSGPTGRLAGRRILVTGAASGIGLETARLFIEEGARVTMFDVSADALKSASRDVGGDAVVVDLADSRAITRAVSEAVALMGGVDGVVNCAGVVVMKTLEDMTDEDWSRVLAVNLTAPFLLCRALAPWLKEAGGTIVNVASGAGLLPNGPMCTAYSGSKAGLIGFTKALAAELAPAVRANVVCPGLTRTPMTSFMFDDQEPGGNPPATASYAMQRAAEPREIAKACLFLTSEDASFVTGSTLVADGGRTYH